MNLTDTLTFGKYKGLKLLDVYRGTLHIDPFILAAYIEVLLNTKAKQHYENMIGSLKFEFVDGFYVYENKITAFIYAGVDRECEEIDFNIEKDLENYLSIGNQRTGRELGGFQSLSDFNGTLDKKYVVGGDPQYLSWCIENVDDFFISSDFLESLEQTEIAFFMGFQVLYKGGGTHEYLPNIKTGFYNFPEKVKEVNSIKERNFEVYRSEPEQASHVESGPQAYGYDSWDDMAFNEAFEGDADAWDHYNE